VTPSRNRHQLRSPNVAIGIGQPVRPRTANGDNSASFQPHGRHTNPTQLPTLFILYIQPVMPILHDGQVSGVLQGLPLAG
jgi:hypothetical protein